MSGLKRLRPELDNFLDRGDSLQIMMGNTNQQGLDELVEANKKPQTRVNTIQTG